MNRSLVRLLVLVSVACSMATMAFAQGGSTTTSVAGVVVDKDGGVIPGATVVVKNNATNVSQTTVTNGDGVWSFPTMDPGMYTVTITLEGFKTLVINEVRLLSATPGNLRNTLEVGSLKDEVTVKARTELIRTQSPTVSSTISSEFIKSVPRNDRNALSFLIFLPGVDTPGGAQNSRQSTISGLPQNTINITIDGVSTSNNLQSGDGFFSMVTPRLDAVEEVTLTTATAGADSAAQGATTVRFVTKSGTNVYKGTAYEYFRHKMLNSNTFFNRLNGLGVPRNTVDQYGASLGGPIMIKGLFDGHGRAFFFINWEEQWTPNEASRTRTILNPGALTGNFTYNLTTPTTVNVMALAAQNNYLATFDPTIKALLASIDSAAHSTGTLTNTSANQNTTSFNYFVSVASLRHNPTESVDVNLSAKHHLKGSYYLQRYKDDPDTLNSAESTFPGFPAHAHQNSYRTTGSISERATFTTNLVNEVLGGWQSSPNDFFGDSNPGMFTNQAGFAIGLGTVGQTLTNASPNASNGPQPRNTINWNIDDNMSWLKGNHNIKFGASFTRLDNHIESWNSVPSITLGFNQTNDPANGMFNTTNFPGASSADLNGARQLYALLTGRVSAINGTARLNASGTEFVYLGHLIQAERMDEWGFYTQDSWRWKPNVTLSFGMRYELQMPMVPTKSTRSTATQADLCGPSGLGGNNVGGRFCNLYAPGVFLAAGQQTTYTQYDSGNPGYNVDYNNFAPNVGVAWRPNVKRGLARTILGDPEQATVSAGFSRTFNRERIDRFTGVFGTNPGPTTPANRNTAATGFCLVCPGESWPLLLSQTERLGPPAFKTTPTYPIVAATNNSVAIFDPAIEVPYTDSWSLGLQRSLGKDMAVEVRYIGNKNKLAWSQEEWNGANWIENGLLDEFKLAQANLAANVAAGRGGTFAYFGPGTGTSPLPIFLAAFSAQPTANAGNQALYTSTQFTNSTWVDNLDPYFPGPDNIASSLWTGNSGSWRTNLGTAGFASNFFVMNPNVSSASVQRNLGRSKYNSLQVDLRRRFSQGLQVQVSYTYARRWIYSNIDLHRDLLPRRNANPDNQPTQPQAFKMLWVYDIPVGHGRRFGSDWNKWVNGALGGWQFSGSGRVQVPLYRVTNTKIVGMSFDEAQRELKKVRIVVDPLTGATTVWDMPQDIIDNTIRAFDTDPTTATGYTANNVPTGRYFAPACGRGSVDTFAQDCAPDLFFYGRWIGEFDFKFTKRFPLGYKKVVFDFDVEVFNALRAKNFTTVMSPSASANVFRITSTQSNARTGQLVWRVTW